MKRLGIVLIAVTGMANASPSIATMKSAIENGDVDEASRQGVLAGPAIVEQALVSSDRAVVLAGIAAAPAVEDRVELLEPLALLARGPDRRTAIPAARAASQIARELAHREATGEIADDIADADIVTWRDRFADIALDRTRWIEVRVLAIDTAAQIDRARGGYRRDGANSSANSNAANSGANSNAAGSGANSSATGSGANSNAAGSGANSNATPSRETFGAGVPITAALADPDPAFRRAVVAQLPMPLPVALHAPIASAVAADTDALVSLGAAAALCADLAFDPAQPILDALGAPGIARVQAIVSTEGASRGQLREVARCLAADKSPASAAALRKIKNR